MQQFLQPTREHARAVGVRLKVNPAALEARVLVEGQGHPALGLRPGQKARLDERLEAVADAQDGLAVVHEPLQIIQESVAEIDGPQHTGPQVVAI